MSLRTGWAALAAVVSLGCAGAARKPDAFYDPPSPLPAATSGHVLRSEPVDDGPDGARSFRILYVSTGMKGEPVPVSAMLVVPDGKPPAGGRAVVAWAHPTTGVARDCAPSLQPDWRKTIPGLEEMIAAGMVVVATDYPGLGTAGVHPYLVGASEARAVVDSVRAARNVKEAAAGSRYAVWGHSQGGHAALFTGQLSAELAPELELVGVAAAAPATELATLLQLDLDSKLGKVLTSEALWSWSRVFDTPMAAVLHPGAVPVVEKVAGDCVRNEGEGIVAFSHAMPLRDGFLLGRLSATEPWGEIMRQNTPGASAIRAPVFISQGTSDEVVRHPVTALYAGGLCARGTPVRYLSVPDEAHFRIAFRTAAEAVAWMGDRFERKPAPDECVRSGPTPSAGR